jgi:threonine dehydratase
MIDIETIRAARERIGRRVHRTPLLRSSQLGAQTGTRLWFKAEALQKTGSFKVRGVFNRIAQMSEAERSRGLITISAGNHAQAVAYAACVEGVRATVVMPAHASPAKVEASRAYGADVVLHGDVFAAFARMQELLDEHGYTLLHPFDDEAVIAGHGSAGLEILEDLPDVDVVIVPIGGGGLISGIAAAIKLQRPLVRIIGVEPEGAATMSMALAAGEVVRLDRIVTIADGLAPPSAGEATLAHVTAFVDEVVTVTDPEIVRAMALIMTRTKLFVEPSGAAGLAALLSSRVQTSPDQRVVVVASGGNIDMERLKELI